MAYAPQSRRGPPQGYGQPQQQQQYPQQPPQQKQQQQRAPPGRGPPPQQAHGGYQYDGRGAGPQEQGYPDGAGYGEDSYQDPAPVPYHGKARLVENPPPVRSFESYGGFEDYGNPYDDQQQQQQQPRPYGQQPAHDQGAYGSDAYAQDGYGQGYQQPDVRGAGQAGHAAGNYSQDYGSLHQQRSPPQRMGHGAPPPQSSQQQYGRPMDDGAQQARQYADSNRPSTSDPRGQGYAGRDDRRPPGQGPMNDHPPKPKSAHSNAPSSRPLQPPQTSPQNMSWDNPFGAFGGPQAQGRDRQNGRPHDQQRPSTSHSTAGHHHPAGRKSSESSKPHHYHHHHQHQQQQQQQQQQHRPSPASQGEYPPPSRQDYGQADYNQPTQAPSQDHYGAQRAPPVPPHPSAPGHQPAQASRGGAPNFSRVQSPPIRNAGAGPPLQIPERSNTMPTELPLRTVHSSTPISAVQADLPFREGRAQTPVFASPQYAEPQSAVIESMSDPPTASPGRDAFHQPAQSLQGAISHGHGQDSGGGYNEFFDDYYDTPHDHDGAYGRPDHKPDDEMDMPNFGDDSGNDELHLESGTPKREAGRAAYNPPPQQSPTRQPRANDRPSLSSGYQDHGFDFGVPNQEPSRDLHPNDEYQFSPPRETSTPRETPTPRAPPNPQQIGAGAGPGPALGPGPGAGLGSGPGPNYPAGRGMPPPRGMPRGRAGFPPGGPGRGGFPNPQDRSMSAGPGPRPPGAPYGPPGPGGRGMPPMRGRGAPGGFPADGRGGFPPGEGRGGFPPGEGRGGFAPGEGRGGYPPGPGTPGPGGAPGQGPPGPMGGRGGPMGGRSRGGPPGPGAGRGGPTPPLDGGMQPPAPVRPGLAQQGGGGARPPPVRHYNSAPAPGQPPSQYAPPPAASAAAAAEAPVTTLELQRLRMAVQDNPGDQGAAMTMVKKLVEASTTLAGEDGRADPKAKAKNRERYVNEAYRLLKKLVSYNNVEAMFYMAECYGSGGLGLMRDPKEAFLLYQSAAKLGHAPSAYRVAVCCELGENDGGGTKRDPLKAMQWYRRAATLGDLPAMYKLGVILLKGLLGQNPTPGEAVNWLQRAADRADSDNPHSLHELGLLYEAPPAAMANTIFADENYSYELFTRAAALGYKFSQYRLGQCFEYGQLGCPIDPRQSIGWYSKAAVQEEHQSELALSGWYLTGSEGVIQQSDTEAYLWARKAAQAGLAKAEYAMGYFTETGIGCSANLEDAKRWYWRASAQNFPKARERLEDLRRGGAKAAQTRVSRSTMQKNQGDCKVM